ncbi:MAG: ribosomal protein L7/L12 [Trueperaceae bacterium]|nr:ribosomal protein L7/L12 [Trueperaceae bacterium]
MARLLFLMAAVLLLLFGLGYLGAPRQNTGFIVFAGVLFVFALFSGQFLSRKPRPHTEFQVEHLATLLKEGRKLEAIKYYREAKGVGLKEAKDYVESLDQEESAATQLNLPLSQELEDAIKTIKSRSKIEAIREVRALTGLSLREAKDYVESL